MPQMAPISWLILFFVFSLTFLLFNVFNYYCFFNKTNSSNNEVKNFFNENNKLTWKW